MRLREIDTGYIREFSRPGTHRAPRVYVVHVVSDVFYDIGRCSVPTRIHMLYTTSGASNGSNLERCPAKKCERAMRLASIKNARTIQNYVGHTGRLVNRTALTVRIRSSGTLDWGATSRCVQKTRAPGCQNIRIECLAARNHSY